MKCENDKKDLARWINNEMNETERAAFELHLAACPACRLELETDQQVWDRMGEMVTPEPSASLRPRFYAMLDTYKASEEPTRNAFADIRHMFRQFWSVQPGFRLAYSLVLVVAGLGLGYLINHTGTKDNKDRIASLSTQVNEMKEMMMLSLLENPSASERIRGVSYTSEIKQANPQVVDALLTTLNNDPNVNVRLMTLEALAPIAAKNPSVREGLVRSIVEQESPLVQSALADVMLKLQEKRSVQSFRKLLQQKDLNGQIRVKLEQTITELI
ncbi:zf-HC2 domain-containing protein [Sediminibacterium soli]|uniref:zf-HC2 domain-containing protein n=1 Tax=Sediminibacterium soli TaxID=2698829 RepID=UPI00137B8CEB|nr:zf-HC2 domain-containing protein [Sediminibacterium soli]NCI45649.1 HEAT repeat domain-containing protein [Sediminibacterium soli]